MRMEKRRAMLGQPTDYSGISTALMRSEVVAAWQDSGRVDKDSECPCKT